MFMPTKTMVAMSGCKVTWTVAYTEQRSHLLSGSAVLRDDPRKDFLTSVRKQFTGAWSCRSVTKLKAAIGYIAVVWSAFGLRWSNDH